MLLKLSVENFVLIESLDIEFSDGFTVITGETGAGKSILLGALSLILGKRADTSSLKSNQKKCILEGLFNIKNYHLQAFFDANELDYYPETILRREITPGGKSRAFINDTPVKLDVMKALGDSLVDIHSQYETRTLNNKDFQLSLLDSYISEDQLLKKYKALFAEYSLMHKELLEWEEMENSMLNERDFLQFQYDELEESKLKEGEDEEIEKQLSLLNNAEAIQTTVFDFVEILKNKEGSILEKLGLLLSSLEEVAGLHSGLNILKERLDSCIIELKDMADEADGLSGIAEHNPALLQVLSERMDSLNHLMHKHAQKDVSGLLALKEKLDNQLDLFNTHSEKIISRKKLLNEKKEYLYLLAKDISRKRKGGIPLLEKDLLTIIKKLGMPDARFKIVHTVSDALMPDGTDSVSFTFSANKGGKMDFISRIASGGELSRLMLALKSLISSQNSIPTIIFDEIDMGVSGQIAGKVGEILRDMGNDRQLIAITHLPQIAAKGKDHLFVVKESFENDTRSTILRLKKEERVKQIARMMSDDSLSNASIKAANELLSRN